MSFNQCFFNDYIITLLDEAKKLNISTEDIIKMINKEGEEYGYNRG